MKTETLGRANELNIKTPPTPHRCPVCGGSGVVPNGFYRQSNGEWVSSSTAPEICRSCNGTGIVWG